VTVEEEEGKEEARRRKRRGWEGRSWQGEDEVEEKEGGQWEERRAMKERMRIGLRLRLLSALCSV